MCRETGSEMVHERSTKSKLYLDGEVGLWV